MTACSVTSASVPGSSGLIMLMHFDAHNKRGGVVSIPPQTLVQVPGHGLKPISTAQGFGGPSLLVKTVEQLTHVQIDHYAKDQVHRGHELDQCHRRGERHPGEGDRGQGERHFGEETVTREYTFHAGVNT